jgi:predicted TPR repeat methyltransferase
MAKRYFEGAQHATRYALTRPTYPPELMKKIIGFLGMKYKGVYDYAADVGCGSGQSTQLLSPYFQKVYGYDVSGNQIKEANAKNQISNIEYQVAPET